MVIKVGTSTLTYDTGLINLRRIEILSRVLCDLKNSGISPVLVSSGAIGVGVGKLGLPKRPNTTREKQAVAAVGQVELMKIYSKLFGEYGTSVAQVLLNKDVIDGGERENNAKNTFNTLLDLGVVPIVNENDTISTYEIEFGDNDSLSAYVSHIVNADIDWAEIDSLQAAIAQITSAEIQNVDIDFAKIKDLNADTAIITKGTAGELYISRLAVTEANLVSLSVGQLMVKGADGSFYALSVDETGAVKAEKKLVANADIGDKTIDAGEKMIEGSVTAATLNAREIFGESALIRELIASTLDVDTLFAREAMIAKINALDITGNESIRLYVKSQEEMSAFLRVTENGLEIGRVGDTATFRADNRTLEVTNVKTERLGLAQRMSQKEEWAVSAYNSGLSIKWIGGDA